MLIEAEHYIRSRHRHDNRGWMYLGEDVIDTDTANTIDYFSSGSVEIVPGEDEGYVILFSSNRSRLKARYRTNEGDILGDVEFPIVLVEGEVVELHTSYKSLDLRLSPARVDK